MRNIERILEQILKILEKTSYKPSIYLYPLFIIMVYLLFKNGFFKGFLKEAKQIALKFKIFIIVFAIVEISVVLFLDEFIALSCKDFNTIAITPVKIISKLGNILGNGNFIYSVTVVVILILLLLKKDIKTVMISLASSVYAGIAVTLLKGIISRERPPVMFESTVFFAYLKAMEAGKLFKFAYTSMPSGHTITITAAVVPLILAAKKTHVKILLGVLPVITGFNRIFSTQHWTSDVLAGGVLGILIGIIIYNINKKDSEGGVLL